MKGRLKSGLRDSRGCAFMGVSVAGAACGDCPRTAARLNDLRTSLPLLSSHHSAQGARFQERVSHLLMGLMLTPWLGASGGPNLPPHRDLSQRDRRNSSQGRWCAVSKRRGSGGCLLLSITVTTALGQGLLIFYLG